MSLSIIYAVADNNVIGNNNKLPWNLPADLHYFKALTVGHKMIMGRKTFESLPGILEYRMHMVLSSEERRHKNPLVRFFKSQEEILKLINPNEEAFVIGGVQIFDLFLPYADKAYITRIHDQFEGDAFYAPQRFSAPAWKRTSEIVGVVNEKNPYKHTFQVFERTNYRHDFHRGN